MTTIIAIILITIFLCLSGIHIYWGFGGQWGNGAVIPTNDDNEKAIMPGQVPTFIVAFGLFGFGLIVLMNALELKPILPFGIESVQKYGLLVIAGIFIIRAIGEFNYVGFFKKHKQTRFAQNDTKYYSPLCLSIGILTLILQFSN